MSLSAKPAGAEAARRLSGRERQLFTSDLELNYALGMVLIPCVLSHWEC